MKSRKDAPVEALIRRVVERAVDAARPSSLFKDGFQLVSGTLNAFGSRVDLISGSGVRCVAIGKSAEAMAHEVRKELGGRVSGIIASSVKKHIGVDGFEFYETGHPIPDEESVRAGRAALDLVASAYPDDLIIFLISGGGSASVFVPVEGVSLSDANSVMKLLFENGVPIEKVNLVRRHLSRLGGGKLSAAAPGKKKLSLIISDVVGDDLASIASGPTVADESTPGDVLRFLEESGLVDRMPKAVPAALRREEKIRCEPLPSECTAKVIASNRNALDAARKTCVEDGLNPIVLTRFWEGIADEAAKAVVSIARSIEKDELPVPTPAIVLIGGETTVKVSGAGRGGRNQHLVLSALAQALDLEMNGTRLDRSTFFSFGTDGKDGNSDAAGAFGSVKTLDGISDKQRAVEDYLRRNDSNLFFAKYSGLIETGPTDTNVMDIFGVIVV